MVTLELVRKGALDKQALEVTCLREKIMVVIVSHNNDSLSGVEVRMITGDAS